MSIIKPVLFGTGAIIAAVALAVIAGAGVAGITVQSELAKAPEPAIVVWN